MLPRLKQLIDEVGPLNSKLILLIGPPDCGKTALLAAFAEQALADQAGASVMNLGLELGTRLAKLPQKQRRLQAGNLLREIANEHANGDLLLIDNIELLFDARLRSTRSTCSNVWPTPGVSSRHGLGSIGRAAPGHVLLTPRPAIRSTGTTPSMA